MSRPRVVCFCGSTRFIAEMAVAMWECEKAGHIALGCHLLPAWYTNIRRHHQAEHEGVAAALDELHLRKIDMADQVVVVNVDGYVGESTRREIEYARGLGKPVSFVYDEDGIPLTPDAQLRKPTNFLRYLDGVCELGARIGAEAVAEQRGRAETPAGMEGGPCGPSPRPSPPRGEGAGALPAFPGVSPPAGSAPPR